MAKKRSLPSKAKAREILRDGTVHGKPLTKAQRGLMGLLAGGGKPNKLRKKRGKSKK